jgi:conjugative transfer signal peptidase TraF
MIGQLYGTAESAPGSLNWRLKMSQLEAARWIGQLTGGVVIATVFLFAIGSVFGLLISNTDSAAAVGLYRMNSGEARRGDLVVACLPIAIAQEGLTRGYLRTGPCPGNAEPVGKILGALQGDTVQIESNAVSVNGVRFARSAVAERDSRGRPLHHVYFGKYRVSRDQVWLFGFNDRRSWDSRYFGPTPLANVCGRIEPILTW